MPEGRYKYVIVGAGLAGASAVSGIREHDESGSILLVGNEDHLPYNRPPLSKDLWLGKKEVKDIFVNGEEFYRKNEVKIVLSTKIVKLEPPDQLIIDQSGNRYVYEKLLLATGGIPKKLDIPGDDLGTIYYYHYLDDFNQLEPKVSKGKSAVVIGGGFIGSEMAAALSIKGMKTMMIFPESYLLRRIFPPDLGQAIQDDYLSKGIKILSGDVPKSFESEAGKYVTRTKKGKEIKSDLLIVGIGITPCTSLAEKGGLKVNNGISVDQYLQTSDSNIYAAGDNAFFPYRALDRKMRIEHWDNALNQGKYAGRNMAGLKEPYNYMPYFFSDLFDFGFEAVGKINEDMETFSSWEEEYETGVVYYLKENKVRGAMMCNLWGKVDQARELIKADKKVSPKDLKGALN